MKCPICEGGGEVRGFSLHWDDDGTTACPCCRGSGFVRKNAYIKYRKEQELSDKQEAEFEKQIEEFYDAE